LKTVDASANLYLALGSVISAGLDGIKRSLDVGEPVDTDPANIAIAEREKRGIYALPSCLGDAISNERVPEAIANLNNNDMLKNALGSELAKAFIAVRQAEWEAMKNMEI